MCEVHMKGFFRQLFCMHDYVHKETRRVRKLYDGKVVGSERVHLYQCSKCGKYKKIAIKLY